MAFRPFDASRTTRHYRETMDREYQARKFEAKGGGYGIFGSFVVLGLISWGLLTLCQNPNIWDFFRGIFGIVGWVSMILSGVMGFFCIGALFEGTKESQEDDMAKLLVPHSDRLEMTKINGVISPPYGLSFAENGHVFDIETSDPLLTVLAETYKSPYGSIHANSYFTLYKDSETAVLFIVKWGLKYDAGSGATITGVDIEPWEVLSWPRSYYSETLAKHDQTDIHDRIFQAFGQDGLRFLQGEVCSPTYGNHFIRLNFVGNPQIVNHDEHIYPWDGVDHESQVMDALEDAQFRAAFGDPEEILENARANTARELQEASDEPQDPVEDPFEMDEQERAYLRREIELRKATLANTGGLYVRDEDISLRNSH